MKIFLSISSILIELRHSLQLDFIHKWIFIYWTMILSQAITKYTYMNFYKNFGSYINKQGKFMFKYILGVMIFSLGLMACSIDTATQLITPAEPVITPAEPVTPPAEPVITPAEPVITPAEPVITPAEPVITPAEPVITPAEPVITPAEPVITPAEPVITPVEPVITPAASELTMSFTRTKAFSFNWPAAKNATYYELYETATIGSGYSLIETTTKTSFDHVVPLYARLNAKYMLKSCSESACSPDSEEVFISTQTAEMTSSIGYAKASNTDANDYFGWNVSLSSDGNTLAVGATGEESNARVIGEDEDDNSAPDAGAVYVFIRSGTTWTQQAYVKASNTDANDQFGYSVSLSRDGNTLAVGALQESSNATGIIDADDEDDNSAPNAGAVYVFIRSGTIWTQQAYVKARNTGVDDEFGYSVSLSSDGNTLAVGAIGEDSNATGIDGADKDDNSAPKAGAVYVFIRSGTTWTQQAYVKASNTDANDHFGSSVSLSSDGNTLAVGAYLEESNAWNDDDNNLISGAGAVYVFSRSDTKWTQQAYVKASNTGVNYYFGYSVSLSSDGNTLAVGATGEDSNSWVDDNLIPGAGAVYVFIRSDTTWTQQAYVKAINTDANDYFGISASLSSDGNTLAVGAKYEGSNATGIDGADEFNLAPNAGAVYVFSRSGTTWTQQVYVKASNTDAFDSFGDSVSLSRDGNTLAVGAYLEESNAMGIGGDEDDNSTSAAGAVYLY
jgi:hypothetical protein